MRCQYFRELILHIDGGNLDCSCELDFFLDQIMAARSERPVLFRPGKGKWKFLSPEILA
jgi:hypothetical protein